MEIVFTRYDGAFFIGQLIATENQHPNVFSNPAYVVHMPIQIQSRISTQAAIAYQTNIIFLEIEWLRLPMDIIITPLHHEERLAKHYLASLDLFLKSGHTTKPVH